MTRDTVIGETFARAATASIVTAWPLRRVALLPVFFNAVSFHPERRQPLLNCRAA